ncbi:MAG: fibronectin type III domain-containing protein [Desulfohalobiaceae bacterium]|nr:fibronectin type III domain-containing protein [Desulfohalobiaceae bacterium]
MARENGNSKQSTTLIFWIVATVAAFLLFFPGSGISATTSGTASVNMAWDQPSDISQVEGYKIYYSLSGDSYNDQDVKVISDPTQTTTSISGLTAGEEYRFVATSHDGNGNESSYSNEVVYNIPTSSTTPDTDGDGLTDNEETDTYGTDPNNPDTDGDGLSDFEEVSTYSTDPLQADSDGDGVSDGDEVSQGSDPLYQDDGTDNSSNGTAEVTVNQPSGYSVTDLQEGIEYYNDRTYTIVTLPQSLTDGNEQLIITSNADKDESSETFLKFTLSDQATVYVAYDSRASSLPNWLETGFNSTDMTLDVTDPYMGHFNVYEATYGAETVQLGGNAASGEDESGSNYIVIVEPNSSSGTDPSTTDSDSDGLTDSEETDTYETDPNLADTDGDGLSDGDEVNTHSTDPLKADSDGDGLDDGTEILQGTDPKSSDSDSDGLSDSQELGTHGTDPNVADTDNDGLNDGDEVNTHSTDPLQADSDGDGLQDGTEISQGTDPNSSDSDGDGLTDTEEKNTYGTDPNTADSDGDGLNDGDEQAYWGSDWDQDYDGNGVINLLDADADGDSVSDGDEVSQGSDPSYDDGTDTSSNGTVEITVNQPSGYSVTDLQEGIEYYNDRTYTLLTLPQSMTDGNEQLIVTSNDDKDETSETFLEFTLSNQATVYVAFDSRAASLPTWLETGFTPTDMTLDVSDSYMGHFNVYEATYGAETVQLGGNAASGEDGSGSNYIVIVEPNSSSGTEPSTTDSDSDGLTDSEETDTYGTDPNVADTDSDGLNDGDEVNTHSTDPLQADSDGDGLQDGTEVVQGTDPNSSDSDGDGLSDSQELGTYGTDATVSDTDGDGLSDGDEVNTHSTDPLQADSDGDGIQDRTEISQGTDPNSSDSDGDGLSDFEETETYGTYPNTADTDGDGLNDGDEQAYWGSDWDQDYDGDGVTNLLDADADGDSVSDGDEVSQGSDPSYDDGTDTSSNATVEVTVNQPSGYSVTDLQEGIEYYNDRTYTLVTLPQSMTDGNEQLILTSNDDKEQTSETFLEFSLSNQATVYVAYDSRASSLPNWLESAFAPTDMTIDVTDAMGSFNVYEATYGAETVQLGGNAASGEDGAASNYIVIVVPSGTQDSDENDSTPLEVTVDQPSGYSVAALQEGIEYYNDRSFTFVTIPQSLTDGNEQLIVTSNDDKGETSETFLEFTLSEQAAVYVAYDSRASSLPSWLENSFTLTSMTIDVTDSYMGYFNVYEASFEAGSVQLGGNAASGAGGAESNYIVITDN